MLDTLFEHFADEDDEVACPSALSSTRNATEVESEPGPSTLRLAQHIPSCPVYDVTPVSLNLGRTLDEAVLFFNTHWDLPQTLPDGLRLHASTARAFSFHLPLQPEEAMPWRYDVYTDDIRSRKRHRYRRLPQAVHRSLAL